MKIILRLRSPRTDVRMKKTLTTFKGCCLRTREEVDPQLQIPSRIKMLALNNLNNRMNWPCRTKTQLLEWIGPAQCTHSTSHQVFLVAWQGNDLLLPDSESGRELTRDQQVTDRTTAGLEWKSRMTPFQRARRLVWGTKEMMRRACHRVHSNAPAIWSYHYSNAQILERQITTDSHSRRWQHPVQEAAE